MKTNPLHDKLAYKKAILTETIAYLRRQFLDDAGDPVQMLTCEDVIHSSAQVPQESIADFVADLEADKATADAELRQFEIVRQSDTKAQAETDQRREKAAPRAAGRGKARNKVRR